MGDSIPAPVSAPSEAAAAIRPKGSMNGSEVATASSACLRMQKSDVGREPSRYFFGGGISSDSWWNTAVHLPFFFVHTVDAHMGLGIGCPW